MKLRFDQIILLFVLTATVGAMSGATVAVWIVPTILAAQDQTISKSPLGDLGAPSFTPTSTPPSFVKLEPHLAAILVPPGFTTRGISPVASLYRKAKGATPEDRTLSDDRLLGQATAITSDGWFITTQSTLGNLHTADLTIWHEGSAYPVTEGIIDRLNGTVYVRTAAREVSAPAFGQVTDLVPGAEVWTERRARVFTPTIVTALKDPNKASEIISSEIATRRIILDANTKVGDVGSPVWDARGLLLGLIESGPDEPLRVIPVTSISSSAFSLLQTQSIHHATLGIRGRDLASWRFDGDRGVLPKQGFLVTSSAPKSLLKTGDVILRVERDILDGTWDLGEVLSEYKPGATVTLHVRRNASDLDIPVILGDHVTSERLK